MHICHEETKIRFSLGATLARMFRHFKQDAGPGHVPESTPFVFIVHFPDCIVFVCVTIPIPILSQIPLRSFLSPIYCVQVAAALHFERIAFLLSSTEQLNKFLGKCET